MVVIEVLDLELLRACHTVLRPPGFVLIRIISKKLRDVAVAAFREEILIREGWRTGFASSLPSSKLIGCLPFLSWKNPQIAEEPAEELRRRRRTAFSLSILFPLRLSLSMPISAQQIWNNFRSEIVESALVRRRRHVAPPGLFKMAPGHNADDCQCAHSGVANF